MADSFLKFMSCQQFDEVDQVTDKGSKATLGVSFWTPLPPDGWFYLGMYATPNYNNPPSPSGPIWVVQSSETSDTDEDPPLAPPSLLVQTWTCVDGDQSSNLGIYSLVAPPGYIALGSIAVPDFKSPPDPDDYPELMCVRQDLCTQVTVESGNVVWTDKGSKAPLDVTVWLLRGPNMLCGGEPVGRLSGVLSGLGSQGRAQPDPALRRTVMATIPSAAGIRQGRFEVDANGQATYVLPIEVPPGIAGAHPRLGLAYGHHQAMAWWAWDGAWRGFRRSRAARRRGMSMASTAASTTDRTTDMCSMGNG